MINEIVSGDCIDYLKKQTGKIFDVVFTSSPYNRIRNDTYAKFDDVNPNYLQMLCDLTENCLRLTKKIERICGKYEVEFVPLDSAGDEDKGFVIMSYDDWNKE